MMAVTLAVLGERAMIGIVVLGIEHPTRSAILRYTFPPQIGHVSGERRTLGSVTHDARFDGDAARPVRHQPRGRDAAARPRPKAPLRLRRPDRRCSPPAFSA